MKRDAVGRTLEEERREGRGTDGMQAGGGGGGGGGGLRGAALLRKTFFVWRHTAEIMRL